MAFTASRTLHYDRIPFMKNLANRIQEIKNQTDAEMLELEQLVAFDRTLKELEKMIDLEKPTYTYPQVDTLGFSWLHVLSTQYLKLLSDSGLSDYNRLKTALPLIILSLINYPVT